jgi:FkbM family methyltransferase
LAAHGGVAGGLMELVNLALRRPALQSSTSQRSTDPRPAVEAAIATSGDLESSRFLQTGNDLFPWWQVDLGAERLIRRVEILNRHGMQERLTRFTLLGSLDGSTWRTLQRVRTSAARRYVFPFDPPRLARFLRIRVDGRGVLHFRQCQVFGEAEDSPEECAAYYAAAAGGKTTAMERQGETANIDAFEVFIDREYAPEIREALVDGWYERRERNLVCQLLSPGDRVLEAGTAIGLVAMSAAAIVGPENMLTFDANPAMVADAKANFARNGMAIASRCGALVARSRYVEGQRLAFQVSPAFWGSRLGEESEGALRTLQIPTFCLEDEIAEMRAEVLICDIEGGEVDLLTEADLQVIRLIIMETHTWAVGAERTDAMVRKLILEGFALDADASGQGVLALRR